MTFFSLRTVYTSIWSSKVHQWSNLKDLFWDYFYKHPFFRFFFFFLVGECSVLLNFFSLTFVLTKVMEWSSLKVAFK